jgi:hypothetical protein
LDRRQSWCVSTDPEFYHKASELWVSILSHRKTSSSYASMKSLTQALERAQGYIRLPNGRAVTGFAHEYERHGTTLCSRLLKPPLVWLRSAITKSAPMALT